MEALILKQEDKLDNLIKAHSNYKKSPKERITQSYIESRLENLEKLWDSFTELHSKIVANIKREDKLKLDYFKDDVHDQFEETYTEYKTKLKEDLRTRSSESVSTPVHANQSTSTNDVKLPRIQLPTFSGSYEEWQTFFDMFSSLIHQNASLGAVQKLHYLKSSLTGEPEQLLRNLLTTEANYDEAWNRLLRRYNNKRYNCNEILKRLFAQRSLTNESASAVKLLLDKTTSCLKSLNNLGIDTTSWDAMVVYLVTSKLDQESRKLWENQISQNTPDDLPTWNQLVEFLETRFRTLEIIDGNKNTSKSNQNVVKGNISNTRTYHSAVQDNNSRSGCGMCSGRHMIYQCRQFAKMSPEERTAYIQSKRLCFNCFAPTHGVRECRQSTCCRRCGRRHHTLLHHERESHQGPVTAAEPLNVEKSYVDQGSTQAVTEIPSAVKTKPTSHLSEPRLVSNFAKGEQQFNEMLLATAIVKAKSRNGQTHFIRALLDQGSQASFVTEETVQRLGLKRVPINGIITGVGDNQTRIKNMTIFNIESRHKPYLIQVNAYIMSKLTSILPTTEIACPTWVNETNIPLADPEYNTPGRIDVLLGAEIYSIILLEGVIKSEVGGPIAQNTHLGWILSGRVKQRESGDREKSISLHLTVNEDQLLKRFWEIETEPNLIEKKLTKEEVKCEKLYESTTTRNQDGRYVVRLPFREEHPECVNGNSSEIALRKFKSLERRLLKNPKLYEDYRKVMEEYVQLNHMTQINDDEEIMKSKVIYLPHHAVVREDKETTKVRVVYNASSKGTNNLSLNDDLMVGPKIQQDLRHILMRWRYHRICLIADLVKMYRQVIVHDQDTNYQRVYWRDNPNQPIQHFKLVRLTFGTACAPYLAVKTLQQLANDEQHRYPIAAEITRRDYYIDDLLSGCETESDAIQIYDEMNKLMKAGGFEIQKWCSNSDNLLRHIKAENQREEKSVTIKEDDTVKILGIRWNKNTDKFEYTTQLPEISEPITKRQVLSDIARLYDPMGWIAPIIIRAKIYIQQLWKAELDWDEPVSPGLLREWLQYREELATVKTIEIPRWLHATNKSYVELHVFADASKVAYAAAVYMKVVDQNGEAHVSLITAKTKVTPISKEITIPRLELCAALLAAKLIFEVAQIMAIPKKEWYAWTDSTVVLAWLQGLPSRWTTFVSNRISEILTILDYSQWGHVKSTENPADVASRGLLISELINETQWWSGPYWLHQTHSIPCNEDQIYTTHEEERPIKSLTAIVEPEEQFMWTKYSELSRMLRIVSYCRRILNLKLPRDQRSRFSSLVSKEEIDIAFQQCVKQSQTLHFKSEISQLKSKNTVDKKSPLYTLNPFLDDKSLLRVGGRLSKARINYNTKHPIILPSKSHLTKLLILDAHSKTLHGGPQIMLNYIRKKYWILRARDQIKRMYKDCRKCLRYSQQTTNQLMGDLPEVRVEPRKPFKAAGVDFSGHINIRFSPGRGSKTYKGYTCLFVCMATKAIHLEAVSDLTAQGFIAAFRRFISRRGHCKDLYSDNGTNFVGADKLLREMFNRATSKVPEEISQLLMAEGTTWHFIPPHAPNFGGLWEAGIRSTKSHLKKVIGESTLTFEELSTVLAQVEACLNSRPLTQISDNPEDPLPLTPGHFLVGEPLIVVPDEDHSQDHIAGLQRWRVTQKIVADFWKRWSNEYLVTLNQRYKWSVRKTEPDIDDVVIIKQENLPPAKWLMGRVVAKHSGKDNITRVVTVKTQHGNFKRPCNKMYILPK